MRGEFIEVGEDRLYYYAAGTRGAGEPIMLLHGFPTSSHLWSNVVSLLPKGHRIVVPDLLGAGRSDLGERSDLSIRGHSERMIGALDVLGIRRVVLVGHHLGATIAAAMSAREPDRVTHLALLHPLAGDVTLTGTLAVMRAFLPLVRLIPPVAFRGVIRRELADWYVDPARARPSVEQYLSTLLKPPRWRAFLRQLAALDAREMQECTRMLGAIRCPVAVVAADHDPAVPRVALDRVREALPSAALDTIRESRHFSPEESPEQVAAAVERLLRE